MSCCLPSLHKPHEDEIKKSTLVPRLRHTDEEERTHRGRQLTVEMRVLPHETTTGASISGEWLKTERVPRLAAGRVSRCNLSSVSGAGVCCVLSWFGGVCGGCLGSWWCRRGGVGSAGLVERAVAQHAVDDVASSACQAHDRRVVAFAFGSFAVVVGA